MSKPTLYGQPITPVGKAPENPDDGYHHNQRAKERAARRAVR
jgi:hypothetical protein